MGRRGPLAQHRVRPLRHVLNLDARHSAIMALEAPLHKSAASTAPAALAACSIVAHRAAQNAGGCW